MSDQPRAERPVPEGCCAECPEPSTCFHAEMCVREFKQQPRAERTMDRDAAGNSCVCGAVLGGHDGPLGECRSTGCTRFRLPDDVRARLAKELYEMQNPPKRRSMPPRASSPPEAAAPSSEGLEKSASDAPAWYRAEQADAWAAGYNAALRQSPAPSSEGLETLARELEGEEALIRNGQPSTARLLRRVIAALRQSPAPSETPGWQDEVTLAVAELRHAYKQAANGVIGNQRAFGDGLLAPQIRRLEKLLLPVPPIPKEPT